MTGLKTFRVIPFCMLLLAGNVFAADNGASASEINNYAKVLRDTIQGKVGGVVDKYEGKQCSIKIHLSRDGSLLRFNTEGGSPDFCNEISDVMRSIKRFPAPPSDAVYQMIKDATLDFKP
ncbi:energry transducer TonB [Salmonella enterica subsp. enterica serovar Panama]|uniref:Energry transducer TonB n=1 Tax=Salmonella enterica subsp. enterica serovar Panama TaxID=29472 RepID=A0A619A853_SALET|nr:energry transducer TonB [Salmonella enterica subsp. enterica serovar Panama]ECX3494408.1 energry transducer TonB [Salmonella enterica subsp. enterica serovar Panama]ECX6032598.1 energry transducer TonB [Salmonella enterica subsp. enterica serovar Panama]EGU5380529.1 energry transducer TonB [Salmonella enterica]EGX1719105.1 energry transducer TonB [Salmonella enterica subsp. enterica serovar Panama]